MGEVRPKLILSDSSRRRRGSGGGSLFMLLIVFAAGVYVGTKLDDVGLWGEKEAAAPVAAVTEAPERASRHAAEAVNVSPAFSGSVSASSGGQETSPYETVTIVEDGRSTEAAQETGAGSGVEGDAGDSAEIGLTSINPESLSTGTGGTGGADEVTILSPDTAAPEGSAPSEAAKKPQTGESYTLQVAAFATPEDGRKAVAQYRAKGYNAYTVEVENSRGEKWTLVKIGRYGSIEQAWSQAAAFRKSEGKEAYVEALGQKTAVNESWGKSPGSDKEPGTRNAN